MTLSKDVNILYLIGVEKIKKNPPWWLIKTFILLSNFTYVEGQIPFNFSCLMW